MARTKARAATPPASRSDTRSRRPLKSGFITRQVATFLAGAAATMREAQARATGGGERASAAASAAQRKAADKLRAVTKASDEEAGRHMAADLAHFKRKEEESRAATGDARQAVAAAQTALSTETKTLEKMETDWLQQFNEATQKLAKSVR